MASKSFFGFELRDASVRGGWTTEGVGDQNLSNYLATREDAESKIADLAHVLEVDADDLRVVEVKIPVVLANYTTGDAVPGHVSDRLAAALQDAPGAGAVYARMGEDDTWEYVRPDEYHAGCITVFSPS